MDGNGYDGSGYGDGMGLDPVTAGAALVTALPGIVSSFGKPKKQRRRERARANAAAAHAQALRTTPRPGPGGSWWTPGKVAAAVIGALALAGGAYYLASGKRRSGRRRR